MHVWLDLFASYICFMLSYHLYYNSIKYVLVKLQYVRYILANMRNINILVLFVCVASNNKHIDCCFM